MNHDFEIASRLFEERSADVPGVGTVTLAEHIVAREQPYSRGVLLHIDGVAHEFEGGPDAWTAVCAAIVELTKPETRGRA